MHHYIFNKDILSKFCIEVCLRVYPYHSIVLLKYVQEWMPTITKYLLNVCE